VDFHCPSGNPTADFEIADLTGDPSGKSQCACFSEYRAIIALVTSERDKTKINTYSHSRCVIWYNFSFLLVLISHFSQSLARDNTVIGLVSLVFVFFFNYTSIFVTYEISEFSSKCNILLHLHTLHFTRTRNMNASLHSEHTTRAYARYHVYILCSRSTTGIDTFASWKEKIVLSTHGNSL